MREAIGGDIHPHNRTGWRRGGAARRTPGFRCGLPVWGIELQPKPDQDLQDLLRSLGCDTAQTYRFAGRATSPLGTLDKIVMGARRGQTDLISACLTGTAAAIMPPRSSSRQQSTRPTTYAVTGLCAVLRPAWLSNFGASAVPRLGRMRLSRAAGGDREAPDLGGGTHGDMEVCVRKYLASVRLDRQAEKVLLRRITHSKTGGGLQTIPQVSRLHGDIHYPANGGLGKEFQNARFWRFSHCT